MTFFVLAIALAAQAQVAPVTVGKAPASSTHGSEVYFAGQPEQPDFAEYAKLGVKVVINLRMPAEQEKLAFQEAEAAKAAGLQYVSVPFGPTPPTDEDLAKIFPFLKNAGAEKVLLHCASSNRAGMVWSLYRGTQGGLTIDDAIAEGKAAGMKNPALEKTARERLEAAKKKD
jgi:uncharacterized protein (TIGR01244 family)